MRLSPMRIAYADPPYPGMAAFYEEKTEVDHVELIQKLGAFDGWALSTASTTLRQVLFLCPPSVRVMAWVKPFASFKAGVNPAYAWEPVIVSPAARKHDRTKPTTRDWVAASITLQKGLVGAKPDAFAYWLFQVLRMEPGDEFVDVYPGTGGVTKAWDTFRRQRQLAFQ